MSIDPGIDARILAEIEGVPAPRAWTRRVWAAFDWLKRGRPVQISPLGGLAVAACMAVIVLWGRTAEGPVDQNVQMRLQRLECFCHPYGTGGRQPRLVGDNPVECGSLPLCIPG